MSRGDVDRRLFIGRGLELSRLLRASQLGFSAIVLGDRGAGTSSLLGRHAFDLEDQGGRVCLVTGTSVDSMRGLATAIRLAADGRRIVGRVSTIEEPRQRERTFLDLLRGDSESLSELEDVCSKLSESSRDGGWTVILDDALGPDLFHGLFGRCRDEVWRLPVRWVVSGRSDLRGKYLEPPADTFFDVEIQLGALSPAVARELVMARLAEDLPEDRADSARVRRRLGKIVERAGGNPRRLLAGVRDVLLTTPEEAHDVDQALLVAASLGKTELAAMHYMLATGPTSASDTEFQVELGVSRSRATQVLKRLEASSLVLVSEMRTGRGRPRRLYRPVGTRLEEES